MGCAVQTLYLRAQAPRASVPETLTHSVSDLVPEGRKVLRSFLQLGKAFLVSRSEGYLVLGKVAPVPPGLSSA